MKFLHASHLRVSFFLLLLLTGQAQALEFKFKGRPTQSVEQAKFIKNPGSAPVALLEPHLDEVVTYVGVPFNRVMDQAYGKKWRNQEEILFTCADGYQSSIPASKFQHFKAWLVWARKDGKSFEIKNKLQGNETVRLGPLYLVWENQHEPELLEGGASDSPYQVVSIDVISFKDRFPKLAPPANSSAAVHEGFLLYRKYCMSCHAIDGEGGKKAPDLKLTKALTRLSPADLRRWILSPSSVKPGTLMPPFAPKLPTREKAVDSLIAYLNINLVPAD